MNTSGKATWTGLVLLGIGMLLVIAGAQGVRAEGPNRVALVVSHGDEVIEKCVEFDEDEISGYEVLERSGIDMNIQAGSDGAAICSLDDKGCTYPEQDCFCQCQGSPCLYWSYWHLKEGAWQYSSRGASNYDASNGDVEGWSWGEGEYGQSGTQPPMVSFDSICSASGDPAATLASGDYVPGTGSTGGGDLPTIDYFQVDRPTIAPGESVTLTWDLHDATAAFLSVGDQQEGVVAPGSKVVAPTTTTEYFLIVRNDAGEVKQMVRVEVDPASAPPPTETPVPPPTDTPVPLLPTDTPVAPPQPPTDTPIPPPTEAPAPTLAPIPAATAAPPSPAPPARDGPPTLTPTSTRTPAPVAAAPATPFIKMRRTPEVLVRTPPAAARPSLTLAMLLIGGGVAVAAGLGGAAALLFVVGRRAAAPPTVVPHASRGIDPRHRDAPTRRSGKR